MLARAVGWVGVGRGGVFLLKCTRSARVAGTHGSSTASVHLHYWHHRVWIGIACIQDVVRQRLWLPSISKQVCGLTCRKGRADVLGHCHRRRYGGIQLAVAVAHRPF
jgi:predicted transcriptional regulator